MSTSKSSPQKQAISPPSSKLRDSQYLKSVTKSLQVTKDPLSAKKGPTTTTNLRDVAVAAECDRKRGSAKKSSASDASIWTKKAITLFGECYKRGDIPCRLVHGGVEWMKAPAFLDYEMKVGGTSLFAAFVAGLSETMHPYPTLARLGLIDLVGAEGAREKIEKVQDGCASGFRAALMNGDKDAFLATLKLLTKMAALLEIQFSAALLRAVLAPIAYRCIAKATWGKQAEVEVQQAAADFLAAAERSVGPLALPAIKAKFPFYESSLKQPA
ncbi:parkin co-regulated protein-domain-containing protein [Cladochytrium replicatum]|nr:parkin co-regulated protein-domain-containing protein [Cladochytrium replicatum]